MNIRRAILLNILLYTATFLIAAVVLMIIGTPLEVSTPPTNDQIFVAMVIGIILTVFGAWWFFRTESASPKKGLYFGIIAILVGFAMDAVVAIGVMMSGQNPISFLKDSYTFFFFSVMLLLVVLLTSAVGWGMGKKKTGV